MPSAASSDAIDRAQKAGALGVKVRSPARLNGAEISRRESLFVGSVPLQNLRADVDYAADFARTIFGAIGVKVWIYRGDIFEKDGIAPALKGPAERPARTGGPGGSRPALPARRPPARHRPVLCPGPRPLRGPPPPAAKPATA